MGADLTITKDGSNETGYFRDSYNESNILWRLGLSYWQLEKQIPIGRIRNGTLSAKQVVTLAYEVTNRKVNLERFLTDELTEDWLKAHNCDAGVESWAKFWREKYEKLAKFLAHAIELKSGIRWSV